MTAMEDGETTYIFTVFNTEQCFLQQNPKCTGEQCGPWKLYRVVKDKNHTFMYIPEPASSACFMSAAVKILCPPAA